MAKSSPAAAAAAAAVAVSVKQNGKNKGSVSPTLASSENSDTDSLASLNTFSSEAKDNDKDGNEVRAEKRKVYIRVVFLKIGEIDTVKECFTADVFVQARWREPSFDCKKNTDPKSVRWDDYWHPMLYADNTVGEPKETTNHTILFNRNDEAFICERRRVKGTFLETMELYQFPFDIQDITVALISERSVDELDLEVDLSEASSINKRSFVDEQEWRLYNTVDTKKDECSKLYESGSRELHPVLAFKCRAARRYGFYTWNICFVMLVICSLTFTSFAVDYKLPQNRLQLTFILLLTTVTFKFVVNQSLPRISYLTYLDKYILTSMGMLVTICIWHAIVYAAIAASGVPGDAVFWIDKWVLVALAILYVLVNLTFFLVICCGVIRKRRSYSRGDKQNGNSVNP